MFIKNLPIPLSRWNPIQPVQPDALKNTLYTSNGDELCMYHEPGTVSI
jgi:hypothetical protein